MLYTKTLVQFMETASEALRQYDLSDIGIQQIDTHRDYSSMTLALNVRQKNLHLTKLVMLMIIQQHGEDGNTVKIHSFSVQQFSLVLDN